MSKSSEAVKKWRKSTKRRMVEAMGGQCQCCGYDKCDASLDFHHLDPSEKELSLGAVKANPVAWPVIVQELRKCILVCSNCHGEIHHGERELPTNFAKFDESFLEYRHFEQQTNECPVCGKQKPIDNINCSLTCAGKARRRIDWDNIDLKSMLKSMSYVKIAEDLGVSDVSVKKRAVKLGLV